MSGSRENESSEVRSRLDLLCSCLDDDLRGDRKFSDDDVTYQDQSDISIFYDPALR